MDVLKATLTNASMAKSEKAVAVGAAIRSARKQKSLSMQAIADALKTSVVAVGNWERGENLPSTENLLKAAEFLGVDPTSLGRGEVVPRDAAPRNDAEIVSGTFRPDVGPMDVPILGSAVGGDDGDFSLNGQDTDRARRPPGIAHLTNVFAIHILSTSMVPRYDPGELLYCGGRAPIPGDHVLIEMHPEEGEAVGKAYVKKLVGRTKGELICEQYNPPKTITFDVYSLKNMWRIIPQRELLGF
ncbi:XRE family transcriptional regulator [Rhizobium leguminosarum]|uniref:XRE family transcriptional regulator n=1 Tax=Rhizobium leguminosarum TaxID=384 RepID=UPI00103D63DF|nr:helix-turn-helix transcriptional regulator [Rhizobium leguminosarum]TBZ94488.1 helix-turn-helix transcriptional regulator [Rhizobium leguminosarum bv. viciae]